jgi:hypothetical protein
MDNEPGHAERGRHLVLRRCGSGWSMTSIVTFCERRSAVNKQGESYDGAACCPGGLTGLSNNGTASGVSLDSREVG